MIMAKRALLRAMAMDDPWADERSEIDERVSSPTANKVNSTIRLRVITRAKPRFLIQGNLGDAGFMAFFQSVGGTL
jgi:hypothetical protein